MMKGKLQFTDTINYHYFGTSLKTITLTLVTKYE